jgi:DedD protein
MSLLSGFRKNKQEPAAGNNEFYSLADEEKPARKRRQSAKRDEPVDPVLPEKKRARRRLIGAIALVLAAVIGLPMILDSEPKPLSDDIAIQIPSRDGAAPLAAAKPDTGKKSQEPAADSLEPNEEIVQPAAKQAVTETPAKPSPDTTPATASVASTSSSASQAKPHEAEKKPTPVAKAEIPEPKSTTASPSRADGDTARARAILEGKTPASANTTVAKPSGKVAVQVAALATEEKVRELQKKLQSAGLKSYTQKVATQSGDRIRVRLGPFANDTEAEKARAKLNKIGLSGKLVPA